MSVTQRLSEILYGPIRYSSGNSVRYELHKGAVQHYIEVRIQGDAQTVFFRSSAGDGWLPLTPDMARMFGQKLAEAADVADTIGVGGESNKVVP